ncbi:MAG: EamA family transporter [Alphaproteobacteria bacterium]|nr:EamA family transporter [Alphaproteobacteria bacterium]
MTAVENPTPSRFSSIPGPVLVWASIFIFGASNSIIVLLVNIGAMHPIDGRNPISFCNLLFVGNLVACVTLAAIFRKSWTKDALRSLTAIDWISLIVLAILSGAIGPTLIFLALETTSVTNVLLMGRIEPPLFLLLSAVLFKAKVNRWEIIGTTITIIGAVAIFWLQVRFDPMAFGTGEIYAAFAAIALVVAALLGKRFLERVPLGIFITIRTGIGTVFFFLVVLYLFDAEHFQDVFSPFLWQWMLVYGAVVVVAGQISWFKGIITTGAAQVSLANSFTPVAGVLFAILLLGETPNMAVLLGGGIIVFGIAVAQLGPILERRNAARRAPTTGEVMALEGGVNFKGV